MLPRPAQVFSKEVAQTFPPSTKRHFRVTPHRKNWLIRLIRAILRLRSAKYSMNMPLASFVLNGTEN